MTKKIYEYCSHCTAEVVILWDVECDGLKAFCPFCGALLLLCSECDNRCCDGGIKCYKRHGITNREWLASLTNEEFCYAIDKNYVGSAWLAGKWELK
jgi:hypothetical protein